MKYVVLGAITGLSVLFAWPSQALAEDTNIEVRVLARGAKFLPGYRDSVRVTLRDAETQAVLASGFTRGGTGNTGRILTGERASPRQQTGDGAAVFTATLDLDRPRLITLEVEGPLHQPQTGGHVTSTQWVLPGRHLAQGDGWLVEMPGLIVDLSTPVAHAFVPAGEAIELRAGITMMCGCGFRPEGPWDPEYLEVEAWLYRNGEAVGQVRLAFTGETSRFAASYTPEESGLYEIEIRAWAPKWNNAGVARTSVFVR